MQRQTQTPAASLLCAPAAHQQTEPVAQQSWVALVVHMRAHSPPPCACTTKSDGNVCACDRTIHTSPFLPRSTGRTAGSCSPITTATRVQQPLCAQTKLKSVCKLLCCLHAVCQHARHAASCMTCQHPSQQLSHTLLPTAMTSAGRV